MSSITMTNKSQLAKEFVETGRLSSISVIDMHTHMGPFYGTYLPEAHLETMMQTMDRENIEWIISAPHSALFDPIGGNSEIRAAMSQYPERIYGYYTVNPHYDHDLERDLEEYDSVGGYVGFKFLPDYHKYPLDGEKFRRIYEFANERGLLILSHTWGHSLYNPPQMVEKLAKKYSNITFLLGHSAPGETDYAIELAKNQRNVYLELCDTGRLSGMIGKMVREASSEKVLFGTDFPWYDPHYMLGSVLFSGISDDDIRNIIHHNAERLVSDILKRKA
ncbi:amidohydrolase family protein [Paenibacillus eucommiae]|uniref:TIM-barrel fold metal-dependent hydrolase n=1 Tax=Paenibacillus eucommiae TaxID=1355755 RepID=A0ABS4ITQ0_9BACL|nr:amidohydrolase family protein [Paenibacillus eucommiae]MBP1990945.1 putative TIM-barrel fold metal-dependent hydrolase [Paenibacillus eucommiae]